MPDVIPDKELISQAEKDYNSGHYGDFINDLRRLSVQTKGHIELATAQMEADGKIPKLVLGTISEISLEHDIYVDADGKFKDGPYEYQGDPAKAATPADPYDGYSGQSEASGIKPKDDIAPSGINQAQNGDCAFLSTMAALANTDAGKQAIMDMITVNATDYTVKFPGSDQVVHVNQTDIVTDGLKNSATWANVLEAAFIKVNGGPQSNVDNTIHLLTGNTTAKTDNFHPLDYNAVPTLTTTSKDEFVADLIAHTSSDGTMVAPVIAATYVNSPLATILGENSGPFVGQHAWSVLSYDQAKGLVTIRNPWGNTGLGPLNSTDGSIKGVGDGKIEMSVESLMTYFADVKFST